MKVLHYSDQGDASLPELYQNCDVMFATGDLTVFDFYEVSGKPMFGVYGNHCSGTYFETLHITNLHLKVFEFGGFKIGGFEGSPRYKEGGGPQYTQEEANQLLVNFPPVDIFLSHAPPFDLLDDPSDPVHVGFHAIRDYIDRTHPKHVFCGHLDPNAELDYQGSKIYRTHGARMIEIALSRQ